MVSGIGLLFGLFTVACARITAATPANPACDSPLEIGTVLSLLPLAPPNAQGIFTYRSVDYRITIRNWEWQPGAYEGTGVVCGLGAPEDIAGLYTVEHGGVVLRNQNGVQIELQRPLPTKPHQPKMEFHLAGALLPRQP